jgi:hypothetical protein
MMHVDDFIDLPTTPAFVREFLDHARRPAMEKDHAWLVRNRPRVVWRYRIYTCVGASRMGDVWLKGDGPPNAFYDHRVDAAELMNWEPATARETASEHGK